MAYTYADLMLAAAQGARPRDPNALSDQRPLDDVSSLGTSQGASAVQPAVVYKRKSSSNKTRATPTTTEGITPEAALQRLSEIEMVLSPEFQQSVGDPNLLERIFRNSTFVGPEGRQQLRARDLQDPTSPARAELLREQMALQSIVAQGQADQAKQDAAAQRLAEFQAFLGQRGAPVRPPMRDVGTGVTTLLEGMAPKGFSDDQELYKETLRRYPEFESTIKAMAARSDEQTRRGEKRIDQVIADRNAQTNAFNAITRRNELLLNRAKEAEKIRQEFAAVPLRGVSPEDRVRLTEKYIQGIDNPELMRSPAWQGAATILSTGRIRKGATDELMEKFEYLVEQRRNADETVDGDVLEILDKSILGMATQLLGTTDEEGKIGAFGKDALDLLLGGGYPKPVEKKEPPPPEEDPTGALPAAAALGRGAVETVSGLAEGNLGAAVGPIVRGAQTVAPYIQRGADAIVSPFIERLLKLDEDESYQRKKRESKTKKKEKK